MRILSSRNLVVAAALALIACSSGSSGGGSGGGSGQGGTVAVPTVVASSQAAAETALRTAGLQVGNITSQASNTVPSGNVISQSPAGGSMVAAGTSVSLVVSLGPATIAVPDVVGLTQSQAENAIVAAGLTVGTVTMQPDHVVPAGDVISQNPAGAQMAAPGQAVAIVVSQGPPPRVTDSFDGSGPLVGYTTNNAAAIPSVERANGRYRALLADNTGNVTLHFNNAQGRLDAKIVDIPFEYIARNVGIGTEADSQTAPPNGASTTTLAGIQVHVTNLNSRNSAHIVVGHSQGTGFTIEAKNTVDGNSVFDTLGPNVVPAGRADLRLVMDAGGNLTAYWQQPNPTPGVNDNWIAYDGDMGAGAGLLPGPAPSFGATVYVGLITYAAGSSGIPFVGTMDSVELVGEP